MAYTIINPHGIYHYNSKSEFDEAKKYFDADPTTRPLRKSGNTPLDAIAVADGLSMDPNTSPEVRAKLKAATAKYRLAVARQDPKSLANLQADLAAILPEMQANEKFAKALATTYANPLKIRHHL